MEWSSYPLVLIGQYEFRKKVAVLFSGQNWAMLWLFGNLYWLTPWNVEIMRRCNETRYLIPRLVPFFFPFNCRASNMWRHVEHQCLGIWRCLLKMEMNCFNNICKKKHDYSLALWTPNLWAMIGLCLYVKLDLRTMKGHYSCCQGKKLRRKCKLLKNNYIMLTFTLLKCRANLCQKEMIENIIFLIIRGYTCMMCW